MESPRGQTPAKLLRDYDHTYIISLNEVKATLTFNQLCLAIQFIKSR